MNATGAGHAAEVVAAFLDSVSSPIRRRDAHLMLDVMTRITGEPAKMWGASIVGFGEYHYKYASGREGDAPAAAFSPRKASMSVYLPDGVGAHAASLERLGDHTVGVGCLYVKKLEAVDLTVLEEIIAVSYRTVTAGTFGRRAAESQG